jgi:hypothetical protein
MDEITILKAEIFDLYQEINKIKVILQEKVSKLRELEKKEAS